MLKTERFIDETVQHLPNAPIQEALLDIQVVLPPDFAVTTLKLFGSGLEERFPETQERIELVQGMQFTPGGDLQSSATTRSLNGYLFISKTEGKTVQARRDGFTFNKLRPYSKWKDFTEEAKELWGHYESLAKPQKIKRLGLRYINRMEIPPDLKDLRDFCGQATNFL